MARFADRFHRPGGFHDRAPCKKLKGNTDGHTLHCRADPMLLSADHAPPLGLLINELVTNAIKYAYPDGDGGEIKVSAREIKGHLEVEVSDEGIGLPDGFDLDKPSASLGFKVIAGMMRQMQGHLTFASNDPIGTRFILETFLSCRKPRKTCCGPHLPKMQPSRQRPHCSGCVDCAAVSAILC